MRPVILGHKINGVATAGKGQRRAKRDTFSTFDRDELAALALSLPVSWVAFVDTHGQVGVTPREHLHSFRTSAVADGERRSVKLSRWYWERGI